MCVKVFVSAMLFVSAVCIYSQEPHVFWYNAQTNGYNIASNPGPGLPSGAIIHEGMTATSANAAGLGFACDGFNLGSAVGDDQGWNSFFWSGDLNDDAVMTGSVDSAYVSCELRDGFAGDMFNQAGPVALRVGVADVSMGVVDVLGGPENVPNDAVWPDMDLMNALTYDMPLIQGTETTVNITGLVGGRVQESDPSTLDSQFVRIDVTPQVNYILGHTGQYAIVFLTPTGQGSVGKINAYGFETCELPAPPFGSDHPWTTDGNTVHLVAYGDPVKVESVKRVAESGVSLAQNTPNPFNPSTSIAFNTGNTAKGTISIFNAAGKLVFSKDISGNGVLRWEAGQNPSGVYLYRLLAGKQVMSKTMILLK